MAPHGAGAELAEAHRRNGLCIVEQALCCWTRSADLVKHEQCTAQDMITCLPGHKSRPARKRLFLTTTAIHGFEQGGCVGRDTSRHGGESQGKCQGTDPDALKSAGAVGFSGSRQ